MSKFKWPWSPAESYSGIGRESPTSTDKMGKTLERMAANADILDGALATLKTLREEMYKQNLKLVIENQELRKDNNALKIELREYYNGK